MDGEDYVVVVDDDPDDLLLANVALSESGCPLPVRLVNSGVELIHLLTAEHPLSGRRTHPPRLILLDLRMPGLSGHRVLEKLRLDPNLASVPVIALSGSMDRTEGTNALSAGAAAYISKNLPSDAFRSALFEALSTCLGGFSPGRNGHRPSA